MNQEKLKATIESLERQGASQREIQEWINSQRGVSQPTTTQPRTSSTSQRTGLNRFVNETMPGVATGFMKDIGRTVRGASDLGERIIGAPTRLLTGQKFESSTGKLQSAAEQRLGMEEGQLTTPEGRSEKFGAGVSMISQFLLPSNLIMGTSRVLQATNVARRLSQGGKLANIGRTALTRGVPEAAGGVGVATLRGESPEDVKSIGVWSAAIPTALKGLSTLTPTLTSMKSAFTGVSSKVFDRVRKSPDAYEEALKRVSETKNPFINMAEEIGSKIHSVKTTAQNLFTRAKDRAIQSNQGKLFNTKGVLPRVNEAISEFNLKIRGGKVIPTTKTSPFLSGGKPTQELKEIQDITTKMFRDKLNVNELFDLQTSIRSSLDRAYSTNDSKMISLLNKLTREATDYINQVLPDVRAANQMYRKYYDIMDGGFGKKVVDSQGIVKPGAESFLSNLPNANKGVLQKSIANVERELGVPILDNITIYKDAQQLNKLFPTTGSRTQDILRSLAITAGAGGSALTGNIFGAGAILAASSPKLAAKHSIVIAKQLRGLKGIKIPKEVRALLDRITGKDIKIKYEGSSIKDVILNKKLKGLSIEDVSKKPLPKGKGEILRTTPLKSKTDNLTQEAKKYKSADEFVRKKLDNFSETTKKPITVYRGEGKGIGNTTLVNGRYFAESEKVASQFGDVTKFKIPAGAKVFNLNKIKSGSNIVSDDALVNPTKLTDFLMDNGYKYTKNNNRGTIEYVKLSRTMESLKQKTPVDTFNSFNSQYKDLVDNYKTFNSFYKAAQKRADKIFKETGEYSATNVKMLREYFNQVKSGNIPKSNLLKESQLTDIWNKANK